MKSGKIVILTAPSGSGKTTLAKYLLETFNSLCFSVSATTRTPRSGEIHGQDYYFMQTHDFLTSVRNHEFFEYQEVYTNQFYGTLHSEINRIWALEKIPLLDIDVMGAFRIESENKYDTLSIFLKASNIEVLRQRLKLRNTDNDDSISKRIQKAEIELDYARHFDYVITNDKLDLAKLLVKEIVSDFTGQQAE
ncbi:MAG: guanylate kinase [Saprospiraceae bacterium]|nr:guanylate kinase [Saprospiraceae bacterium]